MKAHELEKRVDDLGDFYEDRKEEVIKIVKPSLDAYMEKEKTLHKDFSELLRKHATKTFGCDEECLDDCLDRPNFISFWEIPMCVKHCECSVDRLIKLDQGTMNIPHLMKEDGYDSKSWALFKRHAQKYLE